MTDAAERARSFRTALGSFPTGVTVVTTRSQGGHPVGVTASSFNSVSLDPPLVLWSLARSSRSHDDFCDSDHFAVHVLAADQIDLSDRFARGGVDKFAGLDWREGLGGVPILSDSMALFQCRTLHRYEGGDHVILVGEVLAFEHSGQSPLLFHGGRYAEARARSSDAARTGTVDLDAAAFGDDFLPYLLGRAHYQISRPSREALAAYGLGERDYALLGRLSMAAPISADTLVAQMAHTGLGIDTALIDRLRHDGLIEDTPGGLRMTAAARDGFVAALAIAKAQEEALLAAFTPGEAADFKRLLRRLIEASGADVPIAWRD